MEDEKFFSIQFLVSDPAITSSQNKPFEFSFWLIIWKLCIFMKVFGKIFLVENEILNKPAITGARGSKKNLLNSVFGQ